MTAKSKNHKIIPITEKSISKSKHILILKNYDETENSLDMDSGFLKHVNIDNINITEQKFKNVNKISVKSETKLCSLITL